MSDSVLQIEREITNIDPEVIFSIGGFPVTNSFLMIVFIGVLFTTFVYFFVRRFSMLPTKVQSATEMLYEAMLGFVEQIVGSKEAARSIFPLVATLFIYIGASNLIGLIPGVTNFTYNETPIFRTPTADFNTTFGLAFAMVTLIQYIDIKRSGMFAYLGKYFQFKQVWDGFKEGLGAGFVAIIHFCIGLLDIISEFAKIASLALRLFGNMYAGEVLAVILLGAIAYIVPSVWLAMNLLTGVVQAMVFGALIAAYYSLVARSEEGK